MDKKPQPGQVGTLTIQEVQIVEGGGVDGLRFMYDNDVSEVAWSPSVSFVQQAPAEWPPVDQDVWEGENGARFVADVSKSSTELANARIAVGAAEFLRIYAPVKLVLPGPDRAKEGTAS